MPDQIHYTSCPACTSASIFPVLSAKDYTVSKEIFEIWHCDDCTLRFTQQAPVAAAIGAYYQSADYISHSDTGKGLINRLYHLVRNYTLTGKRKLVQRVTKKQTGSLLEVGAGTGAFVNEMQRAGWQVTGLEPDATARNKAHYKYGLTLRSPEELFQLDAARFDAITLWHVLEHVHDLHGYLEQFYRLIKSGGQLIIAVPNYTSCDAKVYKAYWAAYDVPRHLYHFSPKAMIQLVATNGFQPETLHPMWFDSFYVSMLSEQYKTGTGNLIGALWNGLISNLTTLGNQKRGSSVIYIFSKK